MNYKDYQRSRNAAWQILIDCHVTELPVRVVQLCRDIGVTVRRAPLPEGVDGQSMILDGQPIILYRDTESTGRMRFTIAHELGHILLGHVGKYELVSREPSPQDNPIEQAANVFASRLLAPACVLWGCCVGSPEDIMGLCNISRAAAEFRWERMQELYRRNKFLLHPLEQQVYANFRPYIEQNKITGRRQPPGTGR